jgi:hypothetical protein
MNSLLVKLLLASVLACMLVQFAVAQTSEEPAATEEPAVTEPEGDSTPEPEGTPAPNGAGIMMVSPLLVLFAVIRAYL